MADLYRVRIESIRDKYLTCRITELYGGGYHLESSLSLVFGFLWDTVDGHALAFDVGQSSPLGQELAGRDFGDDQDWNLGNAERFISCFGVVDRCVVVVGEDEWSHRTPGTETGQATYNIAVTDPRWIEHLTPRMEWDSRVWHQGWALSFDPAWRTSDVMLLAQGIYDEHAFERMPILADALQEAGCNKEYVLNHLRDTSATHVRGCWALDLVLDKE